MPTATMAASASSTTSTTSNTADLIHDFVSITALNQYGNNEQLQNALKAAELQGRLVLVGIAASIDNEQDGEIMGDVVVVSRRRGGGGSSSTTAFGIRHSNVHDRMLHRLWLHPSPTSSNRSSRDSSGEFLVCSGIRGDIQWLLSTLRSYVCRVWCRYDQSDLGQNVAEKALSHALLTFMGYSRKDEWMDGAGMVVPKPNKEEEDPTNRWSRPLGVQTLLIKPCMALTLIQPSGMVGGEFLAYAMGQGCYEARTLLEERYRPDLSTGQLQELLVSILRKVDGSEEDIDNDRDEEEDDCILIEILRPNGIIDVSNSREEPTLASNAELELDLP